MKHAIDNPVQTIGLLVKHDYTITCAIGFVASKFAYVLARLVWIDFPIQVSIPVFKSLVKPFG
jgi:hypothetical protein